jgi:diacylglycerol kinase family enzyme
MKRGTIAEQRGVEHHRGRVLELGVAPGTEYNADGELRTGGLDRITVEPGAYALVAR